MLRHRKKRASSGKRRWRAAGITAARRDERMTIKRQKCTKKVRLQPRRTGLDAARKRKNRASRRKELWQLQPRRNVGYASRYGKIAVIFVHGESQ